MAGGIGYLLKADRTYESLAKLKSTMRKGREIREFRFAYTVATGGAGATIEAEEKGALTIAPLAIKNRIMGQLNLILRELAAV